MEKQPDIVGKKYKRLKKVCEFDKKKGDETINKEDKDDDKTQLTIKNIINQI